MALVKLPISFKTPAGTILDNAAVSVYLAGTSTAARVFDENSILHDECPQLHTDSIGKTTIQLDDDDYTDSQLFDIFCNPDARCSADDRVSLLSMQIFNDEEGFRKFETVFAQTTIPTTGMRSEDIWFDTDNDNEMYRYDGTNWISMRDGTIATAANTANWSEVVDDDSHRPEDDADVTSTSNFVTVTYPSDQSDVQDQIDGKIVSWFQSSDPQPGWDGTDASHAGDMWWNTSAKQLKRYSGSAWSSAIEDQKALDAYSNAATAQDTADGKRRVFTATPTTPYDIGDLWTGGPSGDIKKCKIARATGAYQAGDWELASEYDATDYTDPDIANSLRENGVLTISRPVGASYSGPTGDTGAIVITLPQSWTNTMVQFTVDVFVLTTSKSFSLHISGYNYITDPQWYNETANLTGSTAADNRVRFGHDGTKCCIVIGETSSVWQYPKVNVRNFQAGHNNYTLDKWDDGWTISTETSLAGYTFTGDFSDALIDSALSNNTTYVNDSETQVAHTFDVYGDLYLRNAADIHFYDVNSNKVATIFSSGAAIFTIDTQNNCELGLQAGDNLKLLSENETTVYSASSYISLRSNTSYILLNASTMLWVYSDIRTNTTTYDIGDATYYWAKIHANCFYYRGTAGVASYGPANPSSITVKGGIITAIS